MGNIDFGLDAKFSIYVVALLLTGVVLLAAATRGGTTQKTSERLWAAIAGIAALGYGVYLGWIFSGGTYQLFWYIFVLPVLLLVGLFKGDASPAAEPAAEQPSTGTSPEDSSVRDGDATPEG